MADKVDSNGFKIFGEKPATNSGTAAKRKQPAWILSGKAESRVIPEAKFDLHAPVIELQEVEQAFALENSKLQFKVPLTSPFNSNDFLLVTIQALDKGAVRLKVKTCSSTKHIPQVTCYRKTLSGPIEARVEPGKDTSFVIPNAVHNQTSVSIKLAEGMLFRFKISKLTDKNITLNIPQELTVQEFPLINEELRLNFSFSNPPLVRHLFGLYFKPNPNNESCNVRVLPTQSYQPLITLKHDSDESLHAIKGKPWFDIGFTLTEPIKQKSVLKLMLPDKRIFGFKILKMSKDSLTLQISKPLSHNMQQLKSVANSQFPSTGKKAA